MAAAGRKYGAPIIERAEHSLMCAGEDPANTNPANVPAREEGLNRL